MNSKWKQRARKRLRSRLLENTGLVVDKSELAQGYPMAFGLDHGGLIGAPDWVKRKICGVWNRINCTLYGHDAITVACFKDHIWPGAPKCINCSSLLKVDGKYPTPEEIAENDRIAKTRLNELLESASKEE